MTSWGVNTDGYHLHVATLQIAMETPSGRSLGLKFSIATAITIVGAIVDGKLLFGIHDWHKNLVQRRGGREVKGGSVAHDHDKKKAGRASPYVRGGTLERRKGKEEKSGATVFQMRRELDVFFNDLQ